MLKAIKAVDRAFHPVERFIGNAMGIEDGAVPDNSVRGKLKKGAIVLGGTVAITGVVIEAFGLSSKVDETYECLLAKGHDFKDRLLAKLGIRSVQEPRPDVLPPQGFEHAHLLDNVVELSPPGFSESTGGME